MQTLLGFQASFTGGEISPDLAVRIDLAKFSTACTTLRNMQVMPHGGAYKRTGFRFIHERTSKARLMPFIFSTTQTYVLVWGEKTLSFATKDGMVLSGNTVYSIATPYTYAEASTMGFVQSADVIYLASHYETPYKLSRFGHANWTLLPLTFTPDAPTPSGLSASWVDNRTEAEKTADGPDNKYWKFRVTLVNDKGEESLPSNISSTLSTDNMRNNHYPNLSWSSNSAAEEYRVYQEQNGRYGYIGSAETNTFAAKNIAPDMNDSFPKAKNPFANGNYPGTVCFFQQRLVFGGTLNNPQTLYFSQTANYENFSTSSPLKANDAIEVTIASNEVSLIQWMISLRSLLIGTAGVEWEVKGSGEGGAITPTGISILPQSYRGSSSLDAQIVGNTILHILRTHREVYDLLYDFGSDSYAGANRAILATHLFENHTITSWAYQQSPDSIVWCIRDDGVLLGMTYMRDHDIYGWHRHDTEGKFIDVCAIPGGDVDDLFVLTERVVNGSTKYFVEVQEKRIVDEISTTNAFYVDCGLSYNGSPITTLTGLDHLIGKTVDILADGGVQKQQVVREVPQAGSGNYGVVLPFAASIVHIGLPYVAQIQSMGLEPQTQQGVSVGREKQLKAIGIYLRATNAAWIGESFDSLTEAKFRSKEDLPGVPPLPKTEEVFVTARGRISQSAYVCVESREPVPLIVLAFTPEITIF